MKSRTASGFDRLAPIYGRISKLVFGNSISEAQVCFLSLINSHDRILILGGDSGEFLKLLLEKHPQARVDYIDLSPTMIELSKDKIRNPANVNFITGTEKNIPDRTYTVVITNFYLDLFPDKTLNAVIDVIKSHLAANATWLIADFVSEKTWHKLFLGTMYAFFKIVAGIEAGSLPDWQSTLTHAGLTEIDSKKFYRGFIKSSVYQFTSTGLESITA